MQFEVATPAELPQWMRQSRRQIDWGFVLTGLIGLVMAWAFILRPGVPVVSDLHNTAFMTSDIAASLREGQLLPRWSPHVQFGFGAPVPSQVPQGAAYLAAVVEQLFTADTGAALAAVVTASITVAAMCMYGWIRALISPTAAVLGAAVYVISPFVGLTIPHLIGDLPLVVSCALLPATLWSGCRVAQAPSRLALVAFAIGLTLQAAVHPQLGAAAAAISILFAFSCGRAAVLRTASGAAAAILLFAPFWLPAVLHASSITWLDNPLPASRIPQLSDLYRFVAPLDPALLNPRPVFSPGLPAVILAVVGALTAFRRRSRRTAILLAGAIAAAPIVIGTAIQPAAWWIVVLNAGVAALAGASAEWRLLLPVRLRRAFVPAGLIMLTMLSTPVWLSPAFPTATAFSPVEQIAFEAASLGSAVLPPGQDFPTTLAGAVRADPNLVESYRQPLLVRIRPGAPVRVTPITTDTHSSAWQISAMSPQTIVVSQAFYPGWQAYLDSVPLPTERDPETGLIRISIPQTASATLVLTLTLTPAHWAGWIVAGLGALILAVGLRFTPASSGRELLHYEASDARLTALFVCAFLIAVIMTVLPETPIALGAEPQSSLENTSRLSARAGPISLVSYRIDPAERAPGEQLILDLYWTANTAPDQNVIVQVELVDLDQRSWAVLSAGASPADIATRRWPPDYLVRDTRTLVLPLDIPAGIYQLSLEAYACGLECTTRQPITFQDSRGSDRRTLLLPQVIAVLVE